MFLDEDVEVIICFVGYLIMIVMEYMENGLFDIYLWVSLLWIFFFFFLNMVYIYISFFLGGKGVYNGIFEIFVFIKNKL